MNLSSVRMLQLNSFRKQVDLLAKLYELSPDLPELVALKERTGTTPDYDPKGLLWQRMINPHRFAYFDKHNVLIVTGEEILTCRTLIDLFVPGLRATTDKFVIDGTGLHIFWPDGRLGASLPFYYLDPAEDHLASQVAYRTARIAQQLFGTDMSLPLSGDRLKTDQMFYGEIVYKAGRDYWFINSFTQRG